MSSPNRATLLSYMSSDQTLRPDLVEGAPVGSIDQEQSSRSSPPMKAASR